MSTPPAAAITLLREGHRVADVVRWTRSSRWHLLLAIWGAGMVVDPNTDTAYPPPVDKTGSPWRDWGRENGWPNLDDYGRLPAGLMAAYLAAHQHDRGALRRAGQAHHRRSA